MIYCRLLAWEGLLGEARCVRFEGGGPGDSWPRSLCCNPGGDRATWQKRPQNIRNVPEIGENYSRNIFTTETGLKQRQRVKKGVCRKPFWNMSPFMDVPGVFSKRYSRLGSINTMETYFKMAFDKWPQMANRGVTRWQRYRCHFKDISKLFPK